MGDVKERGGPWWWQIWHKQLTEWSWYLLKWRNVYKTGLEGKMRCWALDIVSVFKVCHLYTLTREISIWKLTDPSLSQRTLLATSVVSQVWCLSKSHLPPVCQNKNLCDKKRALPRVCSATEKIKFSPSYYISNFILDSFQANKRLYLLLDYP